MLHAAVKGTEIGTAGSGGGEAIGNKAPSPTLGPALTALWMRVSCFFMASLLQQRGCFTFIDYGLCHPYSWVHPVPAPSCLCSKPHSWREGTFSGLQAPQCSDRQRDVKLGKELGARRARMGHASHCEAGGHLLERLQRVPLCLVLGFTKFLLHCHPPCIPLLQQEVSWEALPPLHPSAEGEIQCWRAASTALSASLAAATEN